MRDFLPDVLNRAGTRIDASFDGEDDLRWPKGTIDQFVKAGLLKPAEPARVIRCDGCERECFEQVEIKQRKNKPPLAVIHCREDPDIGRVEIDLARLRRWRFDWDKVRDTIMAALETSGPTSECIPAVLWEIGRSKLIGQDHFFLIYIGAEHGEYLDPLRKTLGRRPGARPVIIHAGAPPWELLDGKPSNFSISLSDCLAIEDDHLIVDTGLIVSRVESQFRALQESTEPFVFRKSGDFWDVRFRGGELKHVEDNVGMLPLAFLLAKSEEAFAALEIDQLNSGNSEYPAPGGSGASADEKTITATKGRIRELSEEITEAEANGQQTMVEKWRNEIEKLEDYLLDLISPKGKPKYGKGDAEKIRKKISIAIDRAIKKIHEHNPDLAAHLKTSIDTGRLLIYRPNEKNFLAHLIFFRLLHPL
ncbi:MAG: hypothetical protein M5R36_08505 [Deltaproteobacteria bacterium]|nr:hypothetical protein [Deltaproteobacteria bacterium]